MAEKNYKSFTGLKEFYYGVLNPEGNGIVETTPERIKFLQEIAVDAPSEISRAFGDNGVAELAKTNGLVTLTTTFHKVPIEDKAKMTGLKKLGTGYAHTPNMISPEIVCAFSRTAEDGGTEWLGFARGLFSIGSISGRTKEDGAVDFGTDEVTAEFMPREVVGIDDDTEGTFFIFYDAPGVTTSRDFLFPLIFGVPHPDAGVPAGV